MKLRLLEKTFYMAGYVFIGIGIGVGLMSGRTRALKKRDREMLEQQKEEFLKEQERLKQELHTTTRHEAEAAVAAPLIEAVRKRLARKKK